MTWTKVYFLLSILCLIPQLGSVTTASGQGQTTDVKVPENGGCDQQCPSMKEREEIRSELHQTTNSAILAMTGPIHAHLQWHTRMEACCFYQHD